jgi:hypothetical protein
MSIMKKERQVQEYGDISKYRKEEYSFGRLGAKNWGCTTEIVAFSWSWPNNSSTRYCGC